MEFSVPDSGDLSEADRRGLVELWAAAFGDRFTADDATHAFGGTHVLAHAAGRIVGHASVVPRRVCFGATWREIGYVEAVAVHPDRQGDGIGVALMSRLREVIAGRWPAAMLSTGRATGFYERLGWERWRGNSYTQTASGRVPDGEHGGLMILRIDPGAVADLTVDVTCEDRPGDAW